ncbi:phage major capsid protein [Clostridium sp. B9]|uniref:phage major capsid protein n=1 Tax=Clostridium sp. B9 TaxID=3423224 RepID=UPI003D2F0CE9
MNRLEDLMNQLEEAQKEAEQLENSENVEEIKACVNKIKTIKAKIELEKNKVDPTPVNEVNEDDEVVNIGIAVAKALVGEKLSSEEQDEVKNLMVEGEKNKGGVLVPQDIQTRIIELQRNQFDIRPYLNVEPVGTNKGSRPIEENEPEAQGFASVDEGNEIQALHEPTFGDIEYAIRDYAGYIPMTNDLLEDSPEAILAFVERWMAKNELNTYNYQVFNGTGNKSAVGILTEATKGSGALENCVKKIDETPTLKTFKTVFNKDLEDLASENINIFTNADGYDFLDGMTDKKGIPYLKPDVTKPGKLVFDGKNTVKVPSKFLKNITDSDITRVPFIIGDLKALYTLYDRKKMSIESTRIGGDSWRKNNTELKGVFRFDGQLVDKAAVKILLVDITKLV